MAFNIGFVLLILGGICFLITISGCRGYSAEARGEDDKLKNFTCMLTWIFLLLGGNIIGL